MNQKRFIVIDIQGFYLDNKLFGKEISVSGVDLNIKTFLIQPPFKYSELPYREKITNKWLYNHLHGLCWDDGNSILDEFREYITTTLKDEGNINIYVKGLEKARWLKQQIAKEEICIFNLDEFNCPNIRTLYKNNENINTCNYHHKNNSCQMCAEKTVIILRNYINLYINKENNEKF